MLVLVRHVAPLECTQSAGGVLNFVVGTVYPLYYHNSLSDHSLVVRVLAIMREAPFDSEQRQCDQLLTFLELY